MTEEQKQKTTDASTTNQVRDMIDPVGYPTNETQVKETYARACESYEQLPDRLTVPSGQLIAAICPHDDYIYAGPLYVPIMQRLTAKLVFILGLSHGRRCSKQDLLIFDDYAAWSGPYGPIEVQTDLRQHLVTALGPDHCQVNRDCHRYEHSLEAMLPFLQHLNRQVRIVPIMVTRMDWTVLEQLAKCLARAVTDYIGPRRMFLGSQVQILISNDSVHYGDQGWGSHNYVPFGTGCTGLAAARTQDIDLIKQYLSGELVPQSIHSLYTSLVDQDTRASKISWCGRFSISFGAMFLYYLSSLNADIGPLSGHLFDYNTSVELGELPVRHYGLGSTAPANLHHWVGYTSLGYFTDQGVLRG
ncbi:AmmeMemoRadiSam system protein B [bacterium]|nr:AmmeMemoRadiSam system protein B [bacterium]